MLPSSLDAATFAILFSVLMAMMLGMLGTWVWALRRLWLRLPLLDDMHPAPAREVPWGGATMALTVFLYLLVSVLVVRAYEGATGRRLPKRDSVIQKTVPSSDDKPTEADKPATASGPAPVPGGVGRQPPAPEKPGDKGALQSQGELMIQSAIINLMLLFLVPLLVMKSSGATLADLGWRSRDWPRQLFQGVRAGWLVTPIVFAVQSLAVRIWPSQKHPLEDMVLEQFTPAAALLAVVSAMFLAPVVEEMLFRGMLQQWLIKFVLNLGAFPPDLTDSAADRELELADADEASDAASSSVADEEPDARSFAALVSILVTSLLFAVMHYMQWPAPIAIFVLSIWLGTVFQRGGSLISAIALHGTFNGFSTLLLLLEALSRKLAADLPVSMLESVLVHLS